MTEAAFVTAHTRLRPTPYVPEVQLFTADLVGALWQRTAELAGGETALPFWAFPWAGGQALARHVLDNPALVAGRRVLDLASGSGLVAIAAGLAGARHVTANDIDPHASTAIELNAAANGVVLRVLLGDLLDGDADDFDVVLAGDIFYHRAMTERMLPFLARAHAQGVLVLVGDPGRVYAPRAGFVEVAGYDVPVTRDLEDTDRKRTTILRAEPGSLRP